MTKKKPAKHAAEKDEDDRTTQVPKKPSAESELRARLAAADEAVGECLQELEVLNAKVVDDDVNAEKTAVSQRREKLELERQDLIHQLNALKHR